MKLISCQKWDLLNVERHLFTLKTVTIYFYSSDKLIAFDAYHIIRNYLMTKFDKLEISTIFEHSLKIENTRLVLK